MIYDLLPLTQLQLDSTIVTQIGTMTVQTAINMLDYTPVDFIGFDVSMIESYLNNN